MMEAGTALGVKQILCSLAEVYYSLESPRQPQTTLTAIFTLSLIFVSEERTCLFAYSSQIVPNSV